MSAADAEEGFKVTDRRRRPEALEEPLRAPAQDLSEPSAGRPAPAARTAEGPSARPGGSPTGSVADERSLVGLFVMLGSTAAVALGAPDPVTGETHRDPAQAAEVIDLLGLLRERTEGHRTPEETQVLDQLIYDLQLGYVQVTKRSG